MKREWWADGPEDDRDEAAYDRALERVQWDGCAFQPIYDELTERFGENMAILLTDPSVLPGASHAFTTSEITETIKEAAEKIAAEIARKESEAARKLVESWREDAALSKLED